MEGAVTDEAKLGEQGSGLVPPTCSCAADLLHTGAIVIDMPRNSHDYE